MAYLNIFEIESALQNLAAGYPETTGLVACPNVTHEGRQSHVLRVGAKRDVAADGVLILGGVHARAAYAKAIYGGERHGQAQRHSTGDQIVLFGSGNPSSQRI